VSERAKSGLFWKIATPRLERAIIIVQDPVGSAVQIVILIRVYRPQKRPEAEQAKPQGNRDQINNNVHSAPPFKRSAFNVTTSDEADMAMAAISGVTLPVTAIGTAIQL